MGQYSNEPITDARLKKSHDNYVTNEDDWQRFIHHEEDEELKEGNADAWYIEIERQRQFINPAIDIHEQL